MTESLIFNGNVGFAVVAGASFVSAAASVYKSGRQISPKEFWLFVILGTGFLILGAGFFTRFRGSKTLIIKILYICVQVIIAGFLVTLIRAGLINLILLPLAAQSVILLPRRLMLAACGLIYGVIVLAVLSGGGSFTDAVILTVAYGTGIIFVVVYTQIAVSENNARIALAEANEALRRNAVRIEELAITRERNRLAREIHDAIGHYLTVININIKAAQAVYATDSKQAESLLAKAQDLSVESLNEVRRSVAALRASTLENVSLPKAIEILCRDFQENRNLHINFSLKGEIAETVSPQHELTLYRAAQEGLTNVEKHSRARTIEIMLDYSGAQIISLVIKDDGEGAAQYETGFGLWGIKERVQLLGGKLEIKTAPNDGFALFISLPL